MYTYNIDYAVGYYTRVEIIVFILNTIERFGNHHIVKENSMLL